ncbi:cupin domain-containing protein [Streptomyces sp. DSM 118878]
MTRSSKSGRTPSTWTREPRSKACCEEMRVGSGPTVTASAQTDHPGGVLRSTRSRLPAGVLLAGRRLGCGGCRRGSGGARGRVSHEGYHWLYVLRGRLRVVLGDNDFILTDGEVAEFDTHLPHWFGNADEHPVEFLSILGPQGERVHTKASYRR